jgi:hypothetical protein
MATYEHHYKYLDIHPFHERNRGKWLAFLKKLKHEVFEDGSVSVDGDVYFGEQGLRYIPFMFRKVTGFFKCSSNALTSLEGCPKEVGGTFDISRNFSLTSLEYSPVKVGGHYNAANCGLLNLDHCPDIVGSNFNIAGNKKLQNLIGGPKQIGTQSIYDASQCGLISLEGAPKEVDEFYCSKNRLKNLIGGPVKCTAFECDDNQLESLEGAPTEGVRFFNFSKNIKLRSLKGLPVDGNIRYDFSDTPITEKDINNYKSDVVAVKKLEGDAQTLYGDVFTDF